jgi:hypothetical protein
LDLEEEILIEEKLEEDAPPGHLTKPIVKSADYV